MCCLVRNLLGDSRLHCFHWPSIAGLLCFCLLSDDSSGAARYGVSARPIVLNATVSMVSAQDGGMGP